VVARQAESNEGNFAPVACVLEPPARKPEPERKVKSHGVLLGLIVFVSVASAATAGEIEAHAAVQKLLPQATIDRIAPAAAPGWYEVQAQGQIVYVSADGAHLMAGDLWRVDDRVNLTVRRKDAVRSAVLAEVGAERRVVFAADKPRHRVTVFTDFDCGYCRRLHHDIAQYNAQGISVEYLLLPRGGLGSASFDQAVAVWCAVDRKQAFDLAKAGTAPAPATCPNPIADNYALVQRMGGIIGTPAVIDEHGLMTGYQTPEQMVARLDAPRE
jgi:thiol:disulfide interchange protein DsbC